MRTVVQSAMVATLMLGAQSLAPLSAAASAELTPVGTWLTEDGRAKIKTEHCGEGNEHLCGYVVWMKDPLNEKGQPRTDIKNPDPAKRNRPSLGLELMNNLKAEDPTHFEGEIYNAENGKMYNVTVGVDKPDELKVRGCMLAVLCGSQTWARVADLALPTATATKVVSTTAAAKPKAAGAMHHDNNQPPAQ